MQISNNVFIVTGGASGLGGATSRMLAASGGKVVIADVQNDRGEALARELGASTRYVKCNVSSESDGRAAVEAALALGTLRGLVNCAGIAIGEKVVGKEGPHALASFARVININLIGTFNMIRLAADAMSRQDATAERDRRVAGEYDLALGARDGTRLLDREAERVGAGRFGLARVLVDVGRFHAGRHNAKPREQVTAARRGRG